MPPNTASLPIPPPIFKSQIGFLNAIYVTLNTPVFLPVAVSRTAVLRGLTVLIYFKSRDILTLISSQINLESYKRKHHMWKLGKVWTIPYQHITRLTLLAVTMCGSNQTTRFHFPLSLSHSMTISVKKRYANLRIFRQFPNPAVIAIPPVFRLSQERGIGRDDCNTRMMHTTQNKNKTIMDSNIYPYFRLLKVLLP